MDYKSLDSLYNLLPAVYRIRDGERNYRLRSFLRLVASQVKILKEDIDRLWANFFIETCDDWVVSYIGDLVGNKPLHDIGRSNRADVAKTIYFRRRKGTLPMLEELARDVTGWGCHAVDFFQLLDWTQNLNHLRPYTKCCPDLRNLSTLDLVNSPFDSVNHNVDIRKISNTEGWYSIRNIGFFLWRLRSYPLDNVQPRAAKGADKKGCYYFSPLGNPSPLFHHPEREGDEAGLAGEIHVPCPIRPLAFYLDLERYRKDLVAGRTPQSNYYGDGLSLFIKKDNKSLPPESIVCMDLRDWKRPPDQLKYKDSEGNEKPIKIEAGVDVHLGRLIFPFTEEPETSIEVYYNYGFSADADIGGGPYDRLTKMRDSQIYDLIKVKKDSAFSTLQRALKEWNERGRPPCLIQIQDNGIYGGNLDIELPEKGWLVIEAANRKRPCVRLVGKSTITGTQNGGTIVFNGLLIEGGFELKGIQVSEEDNEYNLKCNLNITIAHCTLVPGRTLDEKGNPANLKRASLEAIEEGATDFSGLEVFITNSIVGPLRLPAMCKHLTIEDSIVDAPEVTGNPGIAIAAKDTTSKPGPPITLKRTTIFGQVCVKELALASEVIFTESVIAERIQTGCVRFSYVPIGSKAPRLYRCQPNMSIIKKSKELGRQLLESEINFIKSRLKPCFKSVHYGHPAYGQLSHPCSDEIRNGSEDSSEMGVFCKLRHPQRIANLLIRLEEYLPFGLKTGFIYVT